MYKPLIAVFLAFVSIAVSNAQQSIPSGIKYAVPSQRVTWMDSVQMKLDLKRKAFILNKISQQISSRRNANVNTKLSPETKSSKPLSGGCVVKASFTPSNDTVLYAGQTISYTNTSQNADSYEWLNDVYGNTTTTNYSFGPAIGITSIQLVAHEGACTDTATTYVYYNGTAPTDQKRMSTNYGLPITNEFISGIINAKKDGYLLTGSSSDYVNRWSKPYFVRVSETGCILWSLLLPVAYSPDLRAAITTYDSGFVVEVVQKDDYENTYLIKLDKNGTVLWARSYSGNDGFNWNGTIRELSDHSLLILSGQFGALNFDVTKLNETGGFLWQKRYSTLNNNDQAVALDMVEKDGFGYIAGQYYMATPPSNYYGAIPTLLKIDLQNGNLLWTKGFMNDNKICTANGIHFYKDGLIINGFADTLVYPVDNKWSNLPTLIETDMDGNLRDGKMFFNPIENDASIATNVIVDENNNLQLFYSATEFMDLQPGYADYNFFLRLDPNKNILWQKFYFSSNADYMAQAVAAPFKGIAMAGQRLCALYAPFYGFSENMSLVKVDSNGTGPDQFCYVYDASFNKLDLHLTPYAFGSLSVVDENLQVRDQPIFSVNVNSQLRYNCPDYIPMCTFLKLSGKNSVCNMRDTLEFNAHLDPTCGDPATWTYDMTNIKTAYQDGRKTKLLFNAPGTYKIFVQKPFPCTPMKDSIIVEVAPALTNFSLGNDTSVCVNDSLVLRPFGKYDQYLWQDGTSKDSLVVKNAGRFNVTVTDSCGNTKSDTVEVSVKLSLALDLGGIRSICPSDSVMIVPPPGFQKYEWTPDYNLIASSDGTAIFYPASDTVYKLVVHDNSTCSGSAQLPIRIFPKTNVYAGNDTTVCPGEYVLFTATSNFTSYKWTNGETSAVIDVRSTGKYIVQVTDDNGCYSSDTVQLSNYQKKEVDISGVNVLCKGQNLTLDAGTGFTSYLWQDGTTTQKYIVIDTGNIKVVTTDEHQCFSADSVYISQFAETPEHFLPDDTTVCSYQGLRINPYENFTRYYWSTGETGPYIDVKTAGLYFLQVVNQAGCAGTDSISVGIRDCDAMLVFPNAFTPNNDGVNDVFRLKYPGYVVNYELQIFNRWGQMVFRTSDPYASWNGKLNNEELSNGNYVWIARYTDKNGKNQKISGSVVLIR